MSNMERFTAYFSVAERNKLRSDAAEYGTSENYILRMIVRQHYGMNAPRTPASNTAERADQGERV